MSAGFEATGLDILSGEEYQMILDFGFLRSIPIDIYLTVGQMETDAKTQSVDVGFVSGAALRPLVTGGSDLADIADHGYLLVYNPEYHVYIYFYQGSLYWIADEGFYFEKDGSTHLELYLWTTETEKLSESSRATGKSYDILGVNFEKNELHGNFGQYRVCGKELPTRYPITSIRTGYYSNGWIWQEDFWPVFDFSR